MTIATSDMADENLARVVRAPVKLTVPLALSGETIAIVGESGSGKSTTASALIQLLPGTGHVTSGTIMLGAEDLTLYNKAQMEDIRFGWSIARAVGRLDIGQCVVVRDRSVLAVEAIEGTDAAIRRGGELAGSGAVVVKLKKPDQDFRFDLPATGEKTIATLAAVKGAVLAVEAGQSLLFDRAAMVRAADRAGIVVIGLCEDDQGTLHS